MMHDGKKCLSKSLITFSSSVGTKDDELGVPYLKSFPYILSLWKTLDSMFCIDHKPVRAWRKKIEEKLDTIMQGNRPLNGRRLGRIQLFNYCW
jgi:hypothetical protein